MSAKILVKISGEALAGDQCQFDRSNALRICKDIKTLTEHGVFVNMVVGGGNIVRGRTLKNSGVRKTTADNMGMTATVINGLFIQDVLDQIGITCFLHSSLCLPFGIQKTNQWNLHRQKINEVNLFVGGSGVPYFSTDTMSVVAAIMTNSDVIFKATKTDGIYDKDPNKHQDAQHYPKISFDEAIEKNLKVMDQTAFSLAKEHRVPIKIFSIKENNCFELAFNNNIKLSFVD